MRGLNLGNAVIKIRVEKERGYGNTVCRGKIRKFWVEPQWRGDISGYELKLMHESMGIKKD